MYSGKQLLVSNIAVIALSMMFTVLFHPYCPMYDKIMFIKRNQANPSTTMAQSPKKGNQYMGITKMNSARLSNDSVVSVLNVFATSAEEEKYECVPFITIKGNTPICIYDPVKSDRFISGSLKRTGTWEPHITKLFESILENDRSLNFIDIGANIGVYSLTALKHNRRVVAVDANPNNAKHVRHSVKLGEFENMITLVINAISDSYGYMKVKLDGIISREKNIGGAHVYEANKSDELAVKSIYMDDLLEVINFNRAVMKIDVEASEDKALSHSAKYFSTIDIPYVFMEWQYIDLRHPRPKQNDC
ncbi:uncharacterized protein LOC141902770 [Tubulanus polymorphus]|uniref:uncharacterized protein LOC141902770 n=1 Tax=Tubulanus polymorphus TaxID=672921 RepID=UPI003DA49BF5